ncbi:4-oxalomesaconate tautomerase [Tropicimonas sp. IMCC34043]|uniref:4-oxalomesaconate tautomerase n=1 Tax=Tropicimonas sp. IMCC34043 TaxID=2248760 RepID=UPI000E22F6DB|nr:4-oxalomesaconate tautomerase [Tropicimonas sp. IMCC34043]
MSQTGIPYLFMRGGTSRGPYFRREDLPRDRETLSEVLIRAVGSGHSLNIDGIGGGSAVTTKVAMLSVSDDPWADVDYFFAQISVDTRMVDYKPSCGNILSGVGPAAIEMGIVPAKDGVTEVKIRAVNTGSKVVARVQTPRGIVTYEGQERIDGVPGAAAPITLNFTETVGAATGRFLPTGNLQDQFRGIAVTCMDVAMPMVIARATDFGLTGQESRDELDGNRDFFAAMEQVRLEAGAAMGFENVAESVVPKFGLLAPARNGGSVAARYFMPWSTHPTMAVTGAQCLAACALTPGTVSDGLVDRPQISPARIVLEHPSGQIDLTVDFDMHDGALRLHSVGLVRTARKLADGKVYVPTGLWNGAAT